MVGVFEHALKKTQASKIVSRTAALIVEPVLVPTKTSFPVPLDHPFRGLFGLIAQ